MATLNQLNHPYLSFTYQQKISKGGGTFFSSSLNDSTEFLMFRIKWQQVILASQKQIKGEKTAALCLHFKIIIYSRVMGVTLGFRDINPNKH